MGFTSPIPVLRSFFKRLRDTGIVSVEKQDSDGRDAYDGPEKDSY